MKSTRHDHLYRLPASCRFPHMGGRHEFMPHPTPSRDRHVKYDRKTVIATGGARNATHG